MEIVINGIKFPIVFVNDIPSESEDELTLGICEYTDPVIKIRKGLDDVVKNRVIIHEITHAMIFAYALDIYSEEHLCNFMEAHFFELRNLIQKVENNDGTLY